MVMALEYIHRNQIVHRDIKSSNIFLTSCGSIKIGDFGIAKVLNKTLQTRNTLVGTPNYLSPEVVDNKPYTYKTDIWALGCVLYELCSLKVPFQSQNIMELLVKITKDNIEPLPKIYSKEIARLVKGLLSKDENKRPNCQEILAKPMLIRVMQDFIMKDGKYIIQKKVPIKQYSIHNELKKKLPQKIIHKKIDCNKGPTNKSQGFVDKKVTGIKKGSNKDAQKITGGIKLMSPISPVKGVSYSQNKQKEQTILKNPKTNQMKTKQQQPVLGRLKSSQTKKPENDKKNLKNHNNSSQPGLKVAGIALKIDDLTQQQPFKTPISSTKPNEKAELTEDTGPSINSMLMETEISFNISLTQVISFIIL